MPKSTWIAILAAASLWAPAGFTQESRGTIRGRVTDPSGGAAAGARVEATNTETGVRVGSVTNAEGNYEIPYLLPGTYTVSVELSGFKKASREGIQVRVNDRLTVDFALELGSVG